VKKTALGVVLALMLAAIPVTLFASSAVADGTSTTRIAYVDFEDTANIIVDNILAKEGLPSGSGFDMELGTGNHTIVACPPPATQFDGSDCLDANNTDLGSPYNGWTNDVFIGSGGASFMVVIDATGFPGGTDGDGVYTFQNNQNTTGFNRSRFQLNNASSTQQGLSACIDSHDGNGIQPIFDLIPNNEQNSQEITAVQGAEVYVGDGPSSDCPTFDHFTNNFPAGVAFVLTATNSGDSIPEEFGGPTTACGEGCTQILNVGEDTHPNNPDTAVFCANIANLAGVQAGLKDLLGNVDPTSEETIAATQPSAGDLSAFVNQTLGTLTLGDESVPPVAAGSWATATEGLRKLMATFKLVGYDLSALPPSAVEQIVLGANGIKLPGVPVDTDVVGATEALTAFYTSVCVAAPAPTPAPTPTPAPAPVAAAAHFTG